MAYPKARQHPGSAGSDVYLARDQDAVVVAAPAASPRQAGPPARSKSKGSFSKLFCCAAPRVEGPDVFADTAAPGSFTGGIAAVKSAEAAAHANGAHANGVHADLTNDSCGVNGAHLAVAPAPPLAHIAVVAARSSDGEAVVSTPDVLSMAKLRRVSEPEWFDALSQASSCSGSPTAAAAAAAEQLALPEPVVSVVRELAPPAGPWVPNPPLDFADPNTRYLPVPASSQFAAYWMRDDARTTPPPQPIDLMLGNSSMVCRMHDSIPGVCIHETPSQMVMTVKPEFLPRVSLVTYTETFPKNGTDGHWMIRRDIKAGRSVGQLYYTTEGVLIFRVVAKTLWSGSIDWITEEYMHLEEDNQVIIARQFCIHPASGKRAKQLLVGNRFDVAPKGY